MNELSLFTGVGGGVLGSKLLGHRIIGYVENNKYCQKIIAQRIKDGLLDEAPIFSNIQAFNRAGFARSYKGLVDIVSGGFPCQPFSQAGKQLGEKDPRNMWPETAVVISAVKPRYVMLENVPGISKYLPVVIRDLRRIGYTVKRPAIIAAASVGAGHIRRRVWIFAYNDKERCEDVARLSPKKAGADERRSTCLGDGEKISSNSHGQRKLQPQGYDKNKRGRDYNDGWWSSEPGVVRVVHGIPHGVDRLGALGNAQVPAVAATAFRLLCGVSNDA